MSPKRRPSVTVGIPTHNRSVLLRAAINSVLAQSLEDFVLIIADNASDDDTASVVAAIRDTRIKYLRAEINEGMSANFNRIIEEADTDYIAILYDDDLYYPEYLASALDAFRGSPTVGLVHTGFDVIDAAGTVVDMDRTVGPGQPHGVECGADFVRRSMAQDWMACSPSVLFRAQDLRAAHGFRASEEPFGDTALLRRVALRADVAFVPATLVAMRAHPAARSAELGDGFVRSDGTTVGYADEMYRQRLDFIEASSFDESRRRALKACARQALVRAKVRSLGSATRLGWLARSRELARLIISNRSALWMPETWRAVLILLGARRLRAIGRRIYRSSRVEGLAGR